MAVSAIQNDNKNHVSYTKSAFVGALTGYCAKYLIPVLPQEKDDVFISELKRIKDDAKAQIGKAKLSFSKKAKPDDLSYLDEFIRSCNANEKLEIIALKTNIKAIRPTYIFVSAGVILGLAMGFVKNVRAFSAHNINKD